MAQQHFVVTFTGTDFFRTGEAVELWVSGSSLSRNYSGSHSFSPLVKADAGWQALFVIPTRLCSGTLQVAYHPAAFTVSNQPPLFVWPNRERSEVPLNVVSPRPFRP
jgi:hypothetical protein